MQECQQTASEDCRYVDDGDDFLHWVGDVGRLMTDIILLVMRTHVLIYTRVDTYYIFLIFSPLAIQ